jgi:predicted nuclease with TOPRIM domain
VYNGLILNKERKQMENLVITINGLEYVQKDPLKELEQVNIESEKDNRIKQLEHEVARLEVLLEELETDIEVLSFENNSLREGIEQIESIVGNIL